MTQEDKELLLKDLCARLPYKVEIYYSETVPISTLKTINSEKGTCIAYDHSQWYRHSKFHIEEIKPYLRPLSSMTEEEKREYSKCMWAYQDVDFCNEHHLDYRRLIDKELALEAPDGMIKLRRTDYATDGLTWGFLPDGSYSRTMLYSYVFSVWEGQGMSIFSLRGNGNVEFIDISEESVPMLVRLTTIFEKLSGIHIAIYKEDEVKEGGKDDD